jgi:DNA-binding MarR family transcriptional regulator
VPGPARRPTRPDPEPGPAAGPPPGPPGGPAGPPGDSPGFLLMTVGGRVRDRIEQALRAENLSLRHVSALGHLARNPGVSYSELARRAGITPQSMQATLNALEERGAVARDTEPGRGRTARLHVTPEGHRLVRGGMRVIGEVDEEIRALLGPRLSGELAEALRSMLPAIPTGGRPPGPP